MLFFAFAADMLKYKEPKMYVKVEILEDMLIWSNHLLNHHFQLNVVTALYSPTTTRIM